MQGNATTTTNPTGIQPYKEAAFDQYLTFRALGGLLTSDEGKITRMTQDDFCVAFGVNPSTIWRLKKSVPNLRELIDQRRMQIMPLSRVTTAWNQMYLLGMQTQDKRAAVDALTRFLTQFGNLHQPPVKQEIKVEHSLADVFGSADRVIEGEVVDGPAGSLEDPTTPPGVS